MTITTTTARIAYATDGVATVFPVNFKFIQATDLDVYFVSSLGVVTVPALNIDYIVNIFINNLGELVFTPAPLAGGRLVILRQRNLVQDTSAIGKEEFSAAEVETIADNIMFLLQEVNDIVVRSLQLGLTDLDGAGAFDARGNRIKNLGDPVANQDAVTKLWAQGNLVGPVGPQGPPGPGGAAVYDPAAGTNTITAAVNINLTLHYVKAANANTGPATYNGMPLKDKDGAALVGGEIQPNVWYLFMYDGVNYYLIMSGAVL